MLCAFSFLASLYRNTFIAKGKLKTLQDNRDGDHRGPFKPSRASLYGKCVSQQAAVSHVVCSR